MSLFGSMRISKLKYIHRSQHITVQRAISERPYASVMSHVPGVEETAVTH